MPPFNQLPKSVFKFIKRPPLFAYAIGLGPFIGKLILLLTTTGRTTGLRRITPLQYESVDDILYVGSARGKKADWVQNILNHPQVEVRVKQQHFTGTAEVITNLDQIIEFLNLRRKNHPLMMSAMFKTEGITKNPDQVQLENYASQIVLVKITPHFTHFDPSGKDHK